MSAHDPSKEQSFDETRELLDEPEQLREAESALLERIESFGYPEASVFAIRLAFEEAVLNALRHGHKDLPGTPVSVGWLVTEDLVRLRVEDKGPGFKAEELPDPTAPENLEVPHGRGVMLMRAYMTRVSYNPSGNIVTLEYDRAAV